MLLDKDTLLDRLSSDALDLVALIGSVVFAIYAVTVRDAAQIPLLAAGSALAAWVLLYRRHYTD